MSPLWDYILHLQPDVALLQEVGAIPDRIQEQFDVQRKHAVTKRGTPQRFTTAILVRGTIGDELHLRVQADWVNKELNHFAGNFLAFHASPRLGPSLKAISVYSPAWPVNRDRLAGIDVVDVRLTQNANVWPADILYAALREYLRDPTEDWVIAGDFNLSETFDLGRDGPRGNREYLDRMTELGLVECLRTSKGVLTPTFLNTDRRTVKHQMDHLFVTGTLAKRLRACDVGSHTEVFDRYLSDHLPIIADFDVE